MEKVAAFEEAWAEYIGVPHAIAALVLLLLVMAG